jgi:phosphohistidine phosphatase
MAGDNVLLDIPELVRPDVAMSSAAVRAVQTAELVLGQLTDRVPLGTYNSLYEAEPETVETYIREVEEHARSVLIIGHNPTLYRLTWDLLTDGSPDRDLLAHRGFPTCALAVVEFRVDGWDDVSDGQGSLLGLLAPPW